MQFLKNHFEKLLLSVALLALMGTAVFLIMNIHPAAADIPTGGGRRTIEPLELPAGLDEPPSWRGSPVRLFGPVDHYWEKDPKGKWVLKAGVPPDLSSVDTGGPGGGIPSQWFKDHGLDPKEPDIAQEDSDKDNFNNAEEYKYKTHPTKADSFPKTEEYLILTRVPRLDFFLRFKGYTKGPDGSVAFQVNVRDFEFTYFNRVGEQIARGDRKENYRIESFEEKFEEVFDPSVNAKRPVDKSVLTLTRLDDDSKIQLVYGGTATETTLRAVIVNKLDNRYVSPTGSLAKGDEFEVRGRTYKVVDIKSDAVLLSDSLNQEYTLRLQRSGE